MKKLLFAFVLLFLQITTINAQNTVAHDSLEKAEFPIKISSQEKLDYQQKIEQFVITNETKNALFKRKTKAKRKYKSNLLPFNFAENSLRNFTC